MSCTRSSSGLRLSFVGLSSLADRAAAAGRVHWGGAAGVGQGQGPASSDNCQSGARAEPGSRPEPRAAGAARQRRVLTPASTCGLCLGRRCGLVDHQQADDVTGDENRARRPGRQSRTAPSLAPRATATHRSPARSGAVVDGKRTCGPRRIASTMTRATDHPPAHRFPEADAPRDHESPANIAPENHESGSDMGRIVENRGKRAGGNREAQDESPAARRSGRGPEQDHLADHEDGAGEGREGGRNGEMGHERTV